MSDITLLNLFSNKVWLPVIETRGARYVECSITLICLFVEDEHNKSVMPKTLGPLML